MNNKLYGSIMIGIITAYLGINVFTENGINIKNTIIVVSIIFLWNLIVDINQKEK